MARAGHPARSGWGRSAVASTGIRSTGGAGGPARSSISIRATGSTWPSSPWSSGTGAPASSPRTTSSPGCRYGWDGRMGIPSRTGPTPRSARAAAERRCPDQRRRHRHRLAITPAAPARLVRATVRPRHGARRGRRGRSAPAPYRRPGPGPRRLPRCRGRAWPVRRRHRPPDGALGQLVFLKALNSDGVGTELGVARAIRYAVARGVDIINLSLGFYTVRDATPAASRPRSQGRGRRHRRRGCRRQRRARLTHAYPAAFPGVIGGRRARGRAGAGAVLQPRRLGRGVRTGRDAQSAFVGAARTRASPRQGLGRVPVEHRVWSGTSFACGYVSGHLAAVLSRARPASGVPTPRLEGRAGRGGHRVAPPHGRQRPPAAASTRMSRVLTPLRQGRRHVRYRGRSPVARLVEPVSV